MYPSASVTITKLKVSAGDTITASVQYVTSGAYKGQYLLSITDVTTSSSFSIYQSLSSAKRSSAEWVVEAPSSTSGVLALAKFSSITLSSCYATINGTTGAIDTWSSYRINMISSSGSTTLDSTSTLTDSNSTSSFTVTYVSSSSTTTTTTTTTGSGGGSGGSGGSGGGGWGGWGGGGWGRGGWSRSGRSGWGFTTAQVAASFVAGSTTSEQTDDADADQKDAFFTLLEKNDALLDLNLI
jgi:hypothetical protein